MNDCKNDPKSLHIFTFPFKWDVKPKGKSLEDTGFSERTSLDGFDKILSKAHWKENLFHIETPSDYNEYIYFYDFAREALFPDGKNTGTLRQYEYKIAPGSKPLYKIKTIDLPEKPVTYELNIKKILLTTYFTGVGILSFHLANHLHTEVKDILRINEFGRRIYPQFLGDEKDGLTRIPKRNFLADSLEVYIDDTTNFKEDFRRFDMIDNVNRNTNMLSNTIMGLLGNSFYPGELEEMKEKEGIYISPILDDRMFVICWLADKSLCRKLARYDKKNETYRYAEDDDWFKLVFIDKESPTCASIPMKKRLLMEHTYNRWIGIKNCSLFGITRHSFILLNDAPGTFVKNHIKTMYFQMVKLALVQRISILRFSGEATRIADMEESENTSEKLSELQKKYLQFINKIYFREITTYEQGIDLYENIIEAMKIERHVKELDQEIEELHNYASLMEENRKNNLLQKITAIGLLFLIPSILIGYLGINLIDENLCTPNPLRALVAAVAIIVLPVLIWFSIPKSLRKKTGEKYSMRSKILIGIIILILIIMILFPIVSSLFALGE